MDRSNRFQSSLWELQRRLGQNVLVPLSALRQREYLSTGYPVVDELIGQGLPKGQVAAFSGQPSSGATTLAYSLMAQAQEHDQAVVYIDLSATFDFSYAAQCGVVLERLLVVRPEDDANGLEVIRALITAANVALVVLDSFLLHHSQEVFAQLPSALSRVKGGLAKSQCVLLILLSRLPGEGVRASVDTLLSLEHKAWLIRDDDIQGYQVAVTVLKDSQNRSERSVCIDIWLKGEPL